MRTEFLPGTDQPRSGPNTRVKSCGSSKAPSQANVHGWLPVCSTHSVALGGGNAVGKCETLAKMLMNIWRSCDSRSVSFRYPSLETSLMTIFSRPGRLSGDNGRVEHQIRRSLPALERAMGKRSTSTEQWTLRDLTFLSLILMMFLAGSHQHKCVVGCFSETQGWDHRNAQRFCRPRVDRRASATSQRNSDHHGAMQIWPCMIVTVLGQAMNEDTEPHIMSTVAMMTVTTRGSHKTNLESPTTVRTAVTTSTTQLNSGINFGNSFGHNDDDVCLTTMTKKSML